MGKEELHPLVGHLVHFTDDVHHNVGKIKFIWNKNHKGVTNNERSIENR